MHIIITGGVGFIGTEVSIQAMKRGHDITVFDNFSKDVSGHNSRVIMKASANLKGRVKIVRGDVRNVEDLQRIGRADVIINLSGTTDVELSKASPGYDFKVNAVGTLNMLEFSRFQGKIAFIQASIDVNPPQDTSPYIVSKMSADLMCQEYNEQYNIPMVIKRLGSVDEMNIDIIAQSFIDQAEQLNDRKIEYLVDNN